MWLYKHGFVLKAGTREYFTKQAQALKISATPLKLEDLLVLSCACHALASLVRVASSLTAVVEIIRLRLRNPLQDSLEMAEGSTVAEAACLLTMLMRVARILSGDASCDCCDIL